MEREVSDTRKARLALVAELLTEALQIADSLEEHHLGAKIADCLACATDGIGDAAD